MKLRVINVHTRLCGYVCSLTFLEIKKVSAVLRFNKIKKTPYNRISVKFALWRLLNMCLAREGKQCQIKRKGDSTRCRHWFHLVFHIIGGHFCLIGDRHELIHCHSDWRICLLVDILDIFAYPVGKCSIVDCAPQIQEPVAPSITVPSRRSRTKKHSPIPIEENQDED